VEWKSEYRNNIPHSAEFALGGLLDIFYREAGRPKDSCTTEPCLLHGIAIISVADVERFFPSV